MDLFRHSHLKCHQSWTENEAKDEKRCLNQVNTNLFHLPPIDTYVLTSEFPYPRLKQAYGFAQKLSQIFGKRVSKVIAYKKLALWYNDVDAAQFKSFNVFADTIRNNYQHSLNYINNRSTNASAESFNAKVKALRRQFRKVRDVSTFLFRLSKIHA